MDYSIILVQFLIAATCIADSTTTTNPSSGCDDASNTIIIGRGGYSQMAFYRMLDCDDEKYFLYSSLIGVGVIIVFMALVIAIYCCFCKRAMQMRHSSLSRNRDNGFSGNFIL